MTSNVSPEVRNGYLVLLAVFVLSLSLRIWLLDKRWINPDEGAHLMDAVLVLDGKIPEIDFSSRQPLYVYVIAAVLKLFGTSYISGRLMPMTCSVLVGLMIFLIANSLYDRKVAILSATIYWMLPLELMNSVVVKTEPLVSLFICGSIYTLLIFHRTEHNKWLFLAGALACLGFYVRQSALVVPPVIFFYLLFIYRSRLRQLMRPLGLFAAGYLMIIGLVVLFYSPYISPKTIITSNMTPFGFFLTAIGKFFHSLESVPFDDVVAFQVHDAIQQKYRLYARYLRAGVTMHLFLIMGWLFSLAMVLRHGFLRRRGKLHQFVNSTFLMHLWVVFLTMAYAYFYYTKGFYIDYFREFLPPLVIIFSAWLSHHVKRLEDDRPIEPFVLVGLALCGLVFALFAVMNMPFRTILLITVGIVIATFLVFSLKRAPIERFRIPNLINIAAISSIIGSLFVGLAYSGNTLGLSYHSVWSPESLAQTASYLKGHTRKEDRILSGGVIWELQSQRKPFLDISHPLGFEMRISSQEKVKIEKALYSHPPAIIILDGYTERTYLGQFPGLEDLIASHYELALTAGPAKYKVRTYRLKTTVNHPFLSKNDFF